AGHSGQILVAVIISGPRAVGSRGGCRIGVGQLLRTGQRGRIGGRLELVLLNIGTANADRQRGDPHKDDHHERHDREHLRALVFEQPDDKRTTITFHWTTSVMDAVRVQLRRALVPYNLIASSQGYVTVTVTGWVQASDRTPAAPVDCEVLEQENPELDVPVAG